MTDRSVPDATTSLSPFHRAFDRLFPLIRFFQEKLLRQAWFSEIRPGLWLGGAPSYARDYRFLVDHGIGAVVNVQAERADDEALLDRHGIHHVRYLVPDLEVPDAATIGSAVDWMKGQADEGRVVLVHCAKGRGRSAAVVAGYLMREEGLTFGEAQELIAARRSLSSLKEQHQAVLEPWLASQSPLAAPPD